MKYLSIIFCVCLAACQNRTQNPAPISGGELESNGLIVLVVDRPGLHTQPGIYSSRVIAYANYELQHEIWRRTKSPVSRFYIIPTYDGCQILIATRKRLSKQDYSQLWSLVDVAIEKAATETKE